jgi:pSer/pThr/pTyr-binding forkhead associated (FHA) protein
MFNFFKQNKDQQRPDDVKGIRDAILRFIKEQLQKAEGGEGSNIRGIQLYLAPKEEEKHLYQSAVFVEDEGRFKDEIQKIADDFALQLPDNWNLEILFREVLPQDAIKTQNIDAALFIVTRKQTAPKTTVTAYINILNGEAEKENYSFTSTSGKIFIGREKKVQTADGFFRINTIAFPAESTHQSNKYISRQHAHIEWDPERNSFMLYADEGGIPPRNKVKVRTADGNMEKLQTTQIGYPLQEGDQIILGDSALLEFRIKGMMNDE